MNKIRVVAVREFIEVVKTRAFLIGSIFMPLLILGFVFGAERIANVSEQEEQPPRTLLVHDPSGLVLEYLAPHVESHNAETPNRRFTLESAPADATEDDLRAAITSGDAYAFVSIPESSVSGEAPCEIGRGDNQLRAGRQIQRLVQEAIVDARFASSDPPLDRERIRALERNVPFAEIDAKTGQASQGDDLARALTPFAFMFLLFMGTFSISQGLLTSVIEEKSSRVIEVLLSAVSPLQLMAGKIFGMAMVGAFMMLIWGTVGYFSAEARGMSHLVAPYRLVYCALYFLPGFLLFASFLAGIGSACNTVKDAQSMASPMTIITIIPVMLWWNISDAPNSTLSLALSFVPPATPFVMILRVCADPNIPIWQVVATLTVLWISVAAAMWAAGKVFRIGVLMYGKPPSPREMLRWLRYA